MNFLKFSPAKKAYSLKTQNSQSESSTQEEESNKSARKYRLNAIGQVCPFPLVEAKNAISQIASGDYLTIDFDCTQATDSIPAWAAANGHTVTDFQQVDDATWSLTLRKA